MPKQALCGLGLWQPLKAKVLPAVDTLQALTYVATGAAEAGIVYATDAATSKRVKVVLEVPAELTEPICYPVVLLKHGAERTVARDFYRHLQSPAAADIFRSMALLFGNHGDCPIFVSAKMGLSPLTPDIKIETGSHHGIKPFRTIDH